MTLDNQTGLDQIERLAARETRLATEEPGLVSALQMIREGASPGPWPW